MFEVIVGNVGKVYEGNNYMQAMAAFNSYVKDSKANYGRVAGESVTMLHKGAIKHEYAGTREEGDNEG